MAKNADLLLKIASLTAEKSAVEKSWREAVVKLTEAHASLDEYKSIAKAIQAVANPRGTVEDVLSNILDGASEIADAVRGSSEEMEELRAEREALIAKFGLTEHEWAIQWAHERGGGV